jgi:hypothetical protein
LRRLQETENVSLWQILLKNYFSRICGNNSASQAGFQKYDMGDSHFGDNSQYGDLKMSQSNYRCDIKKYQFIPKIHPPEIRSFSTVSAQNSLASRVANSTTIQIENGALSA